MRSIKYFLALWMLVSLMSCVHTESKSQQEKTSTPIENVIEGLKSIQLPKF
jgi:hypothetical protein